jgi:hypothetical protein
MEQRNYLILRPLHPTLHTRYSHPTQDTHTLLFNFIQHTPYLTALFLYTAYPIQLSPPLCIPYPTALFLYTHCPRSLPMHTLTLHRSHSLYTPCPALQLSFYKHPALLILQHPTGILCLQLFPVTPYSTLSTYTGYTHSTHNRHTQTLLYVQLPTYKHTSSNDSLRTHPLPFSSLLPYINPYT